MPNSSGVYPYVKPLYLLVHEERHNESGDPGHIFVGSPNPVQMDPVLEGGSGHAWAAMYTMWVYKYGKYDSPAIKSDARNIASMLLSERFPSRPTHSNPKVQAIIDELL